MFMFPLSFTQILSFTRILSFTPMVMVCVISMKWIFQRSANLLSAIFPAVSNETPKQMRTSIVEMIDTIPPVRIS